jgi:hypothetical protein
MKLNYSEPKIYTGGVAISSWSQLTNEEKKKALSKDWFVYFSFRDPITGKLKKQSFIKAGANKLKTKRERYAFLKTMQQALLELLEYGFNPYEDNSALEEAMFSSNNLTASNKKSTKNQHLATENPQVEIIKKEPIDIELAQINTTISQTFALTLDLKVNMMNKNSFVQYKE